MNNVAIIAEFNPLTNGHNYIINETKKMFPNHKLLIIMSGDFVQRGEPSIINKETRANHAIQAGADVVIELPTAYATSSAEDFAFGAIKTLSSINGVTHLVFGSECGDINKLTEALNSLEEINNSNLKDFLKSGTSFATSAIKTLNNPILNKPNNMLGVMYLKWLKCLNSTIVPITIKRKDNYNSKEISQMASATAIREAVKFGTISSCKNMAPDFTIDELINAPEISLEEYFKLISYKLIAMKASEVECIYGISEGLEHRIIKANNNSTSYDELLNNISSKRYPIGKIKRILLHTLLGLTKNKMEDIKNSSPYIKLLAINNNCKKEILKELSLSSSPLIIKKKDYEKLDNKQQLSACIDIYASNIYSILTNSIKNKDFTRKI